MTDFDRMHKEAFRMAFNYLQEHWPPKWDVEYWKQREKEMGEIGEEYKDKNPLVTELMIAMYSYLGKALEAYWTQEGFGE